MASKPLLSIKSVSASYDRFPVFKNVSLNIQQGEVFGLIGLNGVGKTTLIKLILGLREADEGSVSLQEGKQFSYLPERFEPPWFLSGIEFIKFSLALYGKKIEISIIEKSAGDLELDISFLKKKVHTYSKGMRQKLGLLATVLSGCALLILDEPMSGLDPKARADVKRMILKAKDEGRSVFMSSHILSDIHELCDRVAVFHDGGVLFLGTPDELLKEGKSQSLESSFLKLVDFK